MRTFQTSQKRLRFEKFERVATVLGFIIDTKEFISIVLSVIATIFLLFSNTNNQDTTISLLLNIKITPFHALGPWLLSVYILLGYSRSVWEKQKESKKYRDKFIDFIVYDILFGFRNTILSVLLMALLFTFFWIVIEMIIFWPPLIFICIGIGFFALLISAVVADNLSVNPLAVRAFKEDIDKHWSKWDKLVQSRLEGYQWIGTGSFDDIIKIWKVDGSEIEYLLAKYASKHPRTVKYSRVRNISDSSFYTPMNVLIQLKNLDGDKYWC